MKNFTVMNQLQANKHEFMHCSVPLVLLLAQYLTIVLLERIHQ